jgi:multidrug transporter EmrE-like cation transporter
MTISLLFSLPLLMVILAGVAFAVLGLSYKMAGVHQCRPIAFAGVFLLVATLLAGGRACFETTAWGDPRLWLLGGTMGVLHYGALVLLVTVNRLGPTSISWILLNLSIIIPIVLAPLLLGESFLAIDAGLLVLFFLMLLALRRGMQGTADEVHSSSWRFWALMAAVFLMNGAFQFCSKLKDTFFHDGSAAGLSTLFYGSGMILALLTHAVQTRGLRFSGREWGIGLLAGASAGIGNLLFLNGMSLPAIVAFPVTQGIALIGGVVLVGIVYRERLNPAKATGLLLSLVVLLVAVLRGPLSQCLR